MDLFRGTVSSEQQHAPNREAPLHSSPPFDFSLQNRWSRSRRSSATRRCRRTRSTTSSLSAARPVSRRSSSSLPTSSTVRASAYSLSPSLALQPHSLLSPRYTPSLPSFLPTYRQGRQSRSTPTRPSRTARPSGGDPLGPGLCQDGGPPTPRRDAALARPRDGRRGHDRPHPAQHDRPPRSRRPSPPTRTTSRYVWPFWLPLSLSSPLLRSRSPHAPPPSLPTCRRSRFRSSRASARAPRTTTSSASSTSPASRRCRAASQIDVTFDIDANGMLNVSALEKSTEGEQCVRRPFAPCAQQKQSIAYHAPPPAPRSFAEITITNDKSRLSKEDVESAHWPPRPLSPRAIHSKTSSVLVR